MFTGISSRTGGLRKFRPGTLPCTTSVPQSLPDAMKSGTGWHDWHIRKFLILLKARKIGR